MTTTAARQLLDKQISIVAERRLTWEAATREAQKRAGEFFVEGKDDLAHAFRDFSRRLREQAALASEKQDELLKQREVTE